MNIVDDDRNSFNLIEKFDRHPHYVSCPVIVTMAKDSASGGDDDGAIKNIDNRRWQQYQQQVSKTKDNDENKKTKPEATKMTAIAPHGEKSSVLITKVVQLSWSSTKNFSSDNYGKQY
jgi:hypothetical protein